MTFRAFPSLGEGGGGVNRVHCSIDPRYPQIVSVYRHPIQWLPGESCSAEGTPDNFNDFCRTILCIN